MGHIDCCLFLSNVFSTGRRVDPGAARPVRYELPAGSAGSVGVYHPHVGVRLPALLSGRLVHVWEATRTLVETLVAVCHTGTPLGKYTHGW